MTRTTKPKTETFLPSYTPSTKPLDNRPKRFKARIVGQLIKGALLYLRPKKKDSDPLQEKTHFQPNTPLHNRTTTKTTPSTPISYQLCVEAPPPTSIQEKRQILIDASIAAYPYHQSTKNIAEAGNIGAISATPEEWVPLSTLTGELAKKTGLSVDSKTNCLYDKKTGLTAHLLKQPSTNEIRLVFGGTTSGLHSGGLLKRYLISNPKFTLKQWHSNIKNALGLGIPKNFTQAKMLTENLTTMLDSNGDFKDYHLVLSGHSKGGAEAIYAALSQKQPLEAKVFSCAELHQKLVNDIPKENLHQACSLVKGINIKGDMIPNMRKILPTKLHAMGTYITLPCAHFYNIERHDSFVKHIRYFAEGAP